MSNQSVKMITSSHELIEFCDYLSKQEWIAIDTEFLREKTYYPQLCLIQIATIEQCACIDPLVLPELTPLQQILNNSNIVKVMHAGRQDLEIFYYLNQQIPQPIFDTQLAAPVLGLAEQIAYGKLISAILDIHLEKGHARTDWSQRPLSPAQLDYAANDVIYLAQAYLKMREQLIKANRMSWLDEEFAALTQVALYENPP
ncbi:MAG: ribonuclease D, partial [Gammaproteobacteria bacterium]|nr:ribonuclease D [Gammaproteobacteria bacterium]